jgi:hypothetical protein
MSNDGMRKKGVFKAVWAGETDVKLTWEVSTTQMLITASPSLALRRGHAVYILAQKCHTRFIAFTCSVETTTNAPSFGGLH